MRWVVLCCLAVWVCAAEGPDFTRDVQPILAARCFPCHGSQTRMHHLRLDRRADALAGGESGKPAIVPGKSAESLLIQYVSGQNPKVVMPPVGAHLTSEQVNTLRAWIDGGAEYRQASAGAGHWAFQPVRRPDVPEVRDRAWVRNPIDAFVLARLEARGWKPSPPAPPQVLLRRMYLDVTGLPPTLAEQEQFARDPSLDRLSADLLARPAYGERWARHWLDVVRYAETNGYERDAAKPSVWRYRDYVIRALNADKPFDRFILEQLAGDELEDLSGETLIATTYFRLGPWDDEPADPAMDRFDQLDDMVSTTSQAFLALTLGCARCHDHKFDPLTARDYYSMAAIFNGLERPRSGRTEHDLPAGTRTELAALAERDRRIQPLEEEIGRLRVCLASEVTGAWPEVFKPRIAAYEEKIRALKQATPDLPRAYILDEPAPVPPPMHVLIRGKAASPGPEAPPAVPAVLVSRQPEFPPPGRTSLRRLTLARWIASRENPLTARVIVNRVWQWHFGQGLVRTPNDFGAIGERPTHPELLDWLADWFMDHGWSLKQLHRLILASNTYRMSKRWNPEYGAKDPEDRLFWRVPYVRLEAEAIRDSMLAVSGRLNPEMYGPSVLPPIPAAALEGSSDPDKIWHASDERAASRRTIYAFVKRSMIIPMLEVLDFCDTTRSSAQRVNTSVAPQALTLFNGEFVNQQARRLAERLMEEVGPDPEKQIERAYRLALARPPTPSERAALIEFRKTETAAEMCRVILNLNEFVYPD
ncbi:MAG TPA: PSD1 and planctomycete cytochrome C domain-containing protein [Bryobacteraceae bacterium]|nr:PSD1 and planctomycete cytochrome C domain-containing protein [Bryobacteraceae bacterium]